MCLNDNRYNRYISKKTQLASLRARRTRSTNACNPSRPRCPSCARCASCTGSSKRARSSSPLSVIRVSTMRRSFVSRQRDTSPRFSNRSSSLVMSGSRVIIRLPISPQASPSGAPRRILKTLYCVDDRSSAFRSCATGRESRSAVRISSRKADSSAEPMGRFPSDWFFDVTGQQ